MPRATSTSQLLLTNEFEKLSASRPLFAGVLDLSERSYIARLVVSVANSADYISFTIECELMERACIQGSTHHASRPVYLHFPFLVRHSTPGVTCVSNLLVAGHSGWPITKGFGDQCGANAP